MVWGESVKAYQRPEEFGSPIVWEKASEAALHSVEEIISQVSYFADLATLWAQESNNRLGSTADLELRTENVLYIKAIGEDNGLIFETLPLNSAQYSMIAKTFEDRHLQDILTAVEPLWSDSDRYKQRAAAEFIAGLLRGSKHWPTSASDRLWAWFTERLPSIFNQMKPDTVGFWETLFSVSLNAKCGISNDVNYCLSHYRPSFCVVTLGETSL